VQPSSRAFPASGGFTPSPLPEIRYARSGDVSIAYAVLGGGPVDLVFVHGFAGNLQSELESPYHGPFHSQLASFSRLVLFDRRGTGLSDRMREAPTLETRMDDLRAVLDAIGSPNAIVFGTFEAASMCMLFTATYPERVQGLVLYNPVARGKRSPTAATEQEIAAMVDEWGTRESAARQVRQMVPSRVGDETLVEWWARQQRLGASPGAARTLLRMAQEVDVGDVLPAIRVPTLVMHMPAMRDEAEYVAARIPGARRYEVEGPDYAIMFLGNSAYDEVEGFVDSLRRAAVPDTVLATVLFTDIVGSTAKAVELGNRNWAELVGRHHAVVRTELDRFRGRELDTAGDGFFAAFDGPIRAIRCATSIAGATRELGLEVRAGLHTGECEVVGDKLGGIAVNIGARVAARAGAGEVLVTSTVKDLVAGSGIAFEDRGTADFKGVPGEWRLYAVADAAS
jgi:class 3 adenylate cyclase/pimeloyl-ACP methyl ester carboxylesterase